LAQTYCCRSSASHEKIHNPAGAAIPLGNLWYIALVNGEYEAAERYGKESLQFAEKYGILEGNAGRTNNMGHLFLMKKEYTTAVYWYRKSVAAIAAVASDGYDKQELLLGLTAVMAVTGDKKIAAQLLPDEEAIGDPLELRIYQQTVASIRAELTDAEWQTAVSVDNTLHLDKAISLAFDHIE